MNGHPAGCYYIGIHGPASTPLQHSPHPRDGRVRQARLTISVRFHVYHYSAAAAAAYVSERGTASGVGFHGLTTETNACHFTWKDVNTLHVTH